MEEEKITLSNGKEYTVKEIKYKEMVSDANKIAGQASFTKTLLQKSSGLTDAEYDDLSMKDGLLLQNLVAKVNGLGNDFSQRIPQKNDSLTN